MYRRDALPPGGVIEGPAVIEEFGATTVIGPGDTLRVGSLGELDIALDLIAVKPQGAAHADSRDVDPITAEIIIRSLCAIPNVIDRNITRTAYSVLVSEYKDFAVGMVESLTERPFLPFDGP